MPQRRGGRIQDGRTSGEGSVDARTLEERTRVALDDLYRGALFLCAGDASAAEALLVETVTAALPHPEPCLERRLVQTFLTGSRTGPWAVGATRTGRGDGLLAAAGEVPPRGRAALWLVLVQRRSYAVAAERLDVDTASLRLLLRHGDRFSATALGSTNTTREGSSGADQAGGEA